MERASRIFCGLFLLIGFQALSLASVEELLKKYNTGIVPYVSVEELRMNQLKGTVLILDSRTDEEFKVSHIEDAVFLGVDNRMSAYLENLDRNTPIIVYCSLGIRSEDAASWLTEIGFNNVRNLYGGIFEWKKKDFPVVNPAGKSTQKVHAYSRHWSKWLHNAEKVF